MMMRTMFTPRFTSTLPPADPKNDAVSEANPDVAKQLKQDLTQRIKALPEITANPRLFQGACLPENQLTLYTLNTATKDELQTLLVKKGILNQHPHTGALYYQGKPVKIVYKNEETVAQDTSPQRPPKPDPCLIGRPYDQF